MFTYRLKTFLNFLWHSTNQYGVHPPFLYKFITRCLYAKTPKSKRVALKKARKTVFESVEKTAITDFGAGSQRFSTAERTVSQIAKNAGMPWHQSKLISKIIAYFNIKNALELGTSVGLGSIAMACKNPELRLDTVEACTNTCAIANQHFKNLNLKNISVQHTDFKTFLNDLPKGKTYDLIYLDGHHDKQATLDYYELIKPHMHNETIFILDDIYWSKGMQEAWQRICRDNDVKLSLDLYFWGIIFFKPELSKQDFKIRCFF